MPFIADPSSVLGGQGGLNWLAGIVAPLGIVETDLRRMYVVVEHFDGATGAGATARGYTLNTIGTGSVCAVSNTVNNVGATDWGVLTLTLERLADGANRQSRASMGIFTYAIDGWFMRRIVQIARQRWQTAVPGGTEDVVYQMGVAHPTATVHSDGAWWQLDSSGLWTLVHDRGGAQVSDASALAPAIGTPQTLAVDVLVDEGRVDGYIAEDGDPLQKRAEVTPVNIQPNDEGGPSVVIHGVSTDSWTRVDNFVDYMITIIDYGELH